MKIFKKLTENIKWYIIKYIDAKYPESCWANLVVWSQGGYTLREMFGAEESRWNAQDCSAEGSGAYCGKCVKTGRLKE